MLKKKKGIQRKHGRILFKNVKVEKVKHSDSIKEKSDIFNSKIKYLVSMFIL